MTEPILTGAVTAEGTRWRPSAVHPSEMFWRQLHFGDFDISEMSLSSLIISAAQGIRGWTAIPVFTTRRFFHTGIVVRRGAGIEKPQDLAGKRVGVPEYQQTAAVWSRGALAHRFGVQPEEMLWFMERPPSRSHGGATGFSPPPGIRLSYLSAHETIGDMLEAGSLDASLVYIADRNLVDRTRQQLGRSASILPLFDDPMAEGVQYFQDTGILPVNHTVVIRTQLLQEFPWLALNVYSAFVRAKEIALAPFRQTMGGFLEMGSPLNFWVQIGKLPQTTLPELANSDPLPYGYQTQEQTLNVLADYIVEQGLVSRRVPPAELFAEPTLHV